MRNIRARFEIIDTLQLSETSEYPALETAAFHLRKSIEGVAFGCLVATENGLKKIPRDAVGQWNADKIFSRMSRHKPLIFPCSIDVQSSVNEDEAAKHHIVVNEADNVSIDEIRSVYRRTHFWLHEANPYIAITLDKFVKLRSQLLLDIVAVWRWLLHHLIAADGELFLTVMKNDDGQLEVSSASANRGKLK